MNAPSLFQNFDIPPPGLQLVFFATKTPSSYGDSKGTALRIDPTHWDLQFFGLCNTKEAEKLTAKGWAEKYQCVVTNAGMFAKKDHRTHLGYRKFRNHVNGYKVSKYQSVAIFSFNIGKKAARFRIFDLDGLGKELIKF